MTRALAGVAFAVVSAVAAHAASHRDANGHFHQSILLFAPVGVECTAVRDGATIFHQVISDRPGGSEPPSIDADIAVSHGDISLTCSAAGRLPIGKVLKWAVQILPYDLGPGPCPRVYELDEPWPTTCLVDSIHAYPRYVHMSFDQPSASAAQP